jgi:cytochrome c-type biogenesis protein CcsB
VEVEEVKRFSVKIVKMLVLVVCLAVVGFALPALAQVRNAPAGNSQPDPTEGMQQGDLQKSFQQQMSASTQGHDHGAGGERPKIMDKAMHDAFAKQVDLTEFRKLAIFDAGRAKIVDTVAREHLMRVYGKERWKDLDGTAYDPTFTYLDFFLNKAYYFDKPVIYVDVLGLRRELVKHMPPEEQEKWLKLGRLEPRIIASKEVKATLEGLEPDIMMTNALNQLRVSAMSFDQTGTGMFISPEPGGQYWTALMELGDSDAVVNGSAKQMTGKLPAIEPAKATAITNATRDLSHAWDAADAVGANQALAKLCDAIKAVHPETYPSESLRSLEYYYNKTQRFTIGYVAYLFATLILLISFAGKRKGLINTGVALLFVGIGIHTLCIVVRMALSGRWPIHNQYESYIFISWIAVVIGTVIMLYRKQWVFGAAAAALGTVTLLVANTVDIPSKDVGQVAGILATSRILYIHVNMVLVSYGLIALGFLLSLFYLVVHYTQGLGIVRYAQTSLGEEVAVAGGGAVAGGDEETEPKPGEKAGLLREIDHAQMVVFQLAFYLLGVGILLGAYWADHAWGRWWAWDPKETWALITWIVYLIVIHVRFGVKNRGLTTAWLGVIGFFVMLWCYWGVNMLLAGLHSYA